MDTHQRAFQRLIPTLDDEAFGGLLDAVLESARVRAWIRAEEAEERGDAEAEIEASLTWAWALADEEAVDHIKAAAEREGRDGAPRYTVREPDARTLLLNGLRVWRHG